MIMLMIQLSDATNNVKSSIFDKLFSDQLLPATLTFIASVIGIIAQIVINQLTSIYSRQSEIKKNKLNCVRNFYIPLMNDLISYNANIKILQSQVSNLNIFDNSDSNLRKLNSNLNAVYDSIQKIAQISLEDYYPINRKLNSETMATLFYMIKAAQILSLSSDSRENVISTTKISQSGHNVEPLLNMIYSKGIPKGI